MSILFWFHNNSLIIPIEHGTSVNSCVIPPRCEGFRIFKLSNVEEPLFVDAQEACDGVLIGKCVMYTNQPILKIVN